MSIRSGAMEPPPSSWRTAAGSRLMHERATASYSSSSVSQSAQHVSVRRSPLQDVFSFASRVPISSRTSVEAAFQGTRARMLEMRLKMQHRLPRPQTPDKSMDHVGLIGLTAVTDFKCRHRLTLESTLGCDEDRLSMSTFVSSKFESRISWGLAISHKVHRTMRFFSRYNSDDNARNQFIIQVVHNLNEKTTLSPIFAVSNGCHPRAGISATSQLAEVGFWGGNSLQLKAFYSGGGAYSLSIKAQAGEVD